MGRVERDIGMSKWKGIYKDKEGYPEKEGGISMGNEKMKPVGVDDIFKRLSCEGEEQDVRGVYLRLISRHRKRNPLICPLL